MTNTVTVPNIRPKSQMNALIELPLVFDLFQVLVILTSLCGGFFLLLLIPLVRKKNILVVWTILLFGFLHEFYSVIILIILKFQTDPDVRICADNHETSTKVVVFILCTMITSALLTGGRSWRTLVCTCFIWFYVLNVLVYTFDKDSPVQRTSFNLSLESNVNLYLTSCGNKTNDLQFIVSDYAVLYLPILVILILIRTNQKEQDCRFWNINIIPNCSSDGLCTSCHRQNDALQIVLVYLTGTLYVVRPILILYNLVTGSAYFDVLMSIILVGTYCFLCLDTFSNLRKQCYSLKANYSKIIKTIV